MNYRPFGRTGVKVSPYCLGAMMFGAGGNPDQQECIRIIHKALDAGVNFIDMADAYSKGELEEIVGLLGLTSVPSRRVPVIQTGHFTLPGQFGSPFEIREQRFSCRR